MLAVYKREIQGYFYSALGYVFIGIFMLFAGLFFVLIDLRAGSADFVGVLGHILFQFFILIPISLLTMRILSDERRNKTDQLLLTSPLSLTSIVLGKYFAAVTVFLISLVVSMLFPLILSLVGNPSIPAIMSAYLGFFLMGCALIAVGVFVSSFTENQVVSAVATFGILLALWLMGMALIPIIKVPWLVTVLQWFSVFDRLTPFLQGLFSATHIVYFISFAGVFLFLAIRTVESRRWSEV